MSDKSPLGPVFLDNTGQPLCLDTNLCNVNLQGSLQRSEDGQGLRFVDDKGQPVTTRTKLASISGFKL